MAGDPLEKPGTGALVGAGVGAAAAGLGAGGAAAATGAAILSGPVGWIALGGAAVAGTAGKIVDHQTASSAV